jgi:hypothetical protein
VRGPLGESFAQFLQDQIKACRIAFIAEVLTNANPSEEQLKPNASSVANLLNIEYRVCDAIPKTRGDTYKVSVARADSLLMEQDWLAKIKDKTPLDIIFICETDYVESFGSILNSKNYNVRIISKDWFAEEDLRRKVYSGVALSFLEIRQLLGLANSIARNAVLLNREFGNLFGYLQNSLTVQIFLVINRLFEKQNVTAAHPSLSIPVINNTMKENAGKLRIKKRNVVENGLSKIGYDRRRLAQLSDERIVNQVVDYFIQRLDKLSASINMARNEIEHLLSHNAGEKHVQPQQWDAINGLIVFANEFYEIIGEGILGLSGRLDVSETLDQSFKRLLQRAKMEVD